MSDARAIDPIREFIDAAPDGIVLVDAGGRILGVNARLGELFGYDPQEMVGQPLEALVPERLRDIHQAHRRNYKSEPKMCTMGGGLELFGRRSDGSEFPIEINLSPVRADDRLLVIAIVRDITERKAATDQLMASLQEKEILLREIHHRIKNNMQMIASLLNLRKHTVTDAKALDAFDDCQNRVRAMGVIHQILSRTDRVSLVDLRDYIFRLLEEIKDAQCIDPAHIRFHVAIDDLDVSFDLAFYLGLMLNELVSNCVKHAFPSGEGDITVQLVQPEPGRLMLTVADNGIGMLGGATPLRDDGLGLQLVRSFVTQLHGAIDIRNGEGTVFAISLRM